MAALVPYKLRQLLKLASVTVHNTCWLCNAVICRLAAVFVYDVFAKMDQTVCEVMRQNEIANDHNDGTGGPEPLTCSLR